MSHRKYSLKYDAVKQMFPEAIMVQDDHELDHMVQMIDTVLDIFAPGSVGPMSDAAKAFIDDPDDDLSYIQKAVVLSGMFVLIMDRINTSEYGKSTASRTILPFDVLSGFLNLFRFPHLWF